MYQLVLLKEISMLGEKGEYYNPESQESELSGVWIIAFFCPWIFYKKVRKVINFLDFMLDQAGAMW